MPRSALLIFPDHHAVVRAEAAKLAATRQQPVADDDPELIGNAADAILDLTSSASEFQAALIDFITRS